MPVVRLVPVRDLEEEEEEEEEEETHVYSCPLFQNSERSGEDNFIMTVNSFPSMNIINK